MAKSNVKVLLGFDDELVGDKYKSLQNYTINKIGGRPDLPSNIHLEPAPCPLCQLPRPMVIQIYAPIDSTTMHRTLYLFACINPNCWNSSDSWLCIRIQSQEKILDYSENAALPTNKPATTDWCIDADDWEDENNDNLNGNVVSNEKVSDEDEEESCSMEDSVRSALGNLTVDDKNANVGAQGGAVGRLLSPCASAEIEGNEGEVISIDTPTVPQNDIVALLQEVTPLPMEICHLEQQKNANLLQFEAYFMSVWEEGRSATSNIPDRHVKELLQDYQHKNEDISSLVNPDSNNVQATNEEKYEKSQPAHGDKMFFHFLSKIQSNPGQILRYSREIEPPLLLYPLQELAPRKCQHCQGDLTFEFQLLPTIIPKLKLLTDKKHCARLEFGTILVYTCKNSCWGNDVNMRLETVVLQSEIY